MLIFAHLRHHLNAERTPTKREAAAAAAAVAAYVAGGAGVAVGENTNRIRAVNREAIAGGAVAGGGATINLDLSDDEDEVVGDVAANLVDALTLAEDETDAEPLANDDAIGESEGDKKA